MLMEDLTSPIKKIFYSAYNGLRLEKANHDIFARKRSILIICSGSIHFFQNLLTIIEKINPDLLIVEGDRGESLITAIIGSHFNIPIIHHGGGDLSGSIDNKIRFAITMFADYR